LKGENEKKRERKKMDYHGWLEWQKKEEAEAREAELRYQEERLKLQKERKTARDRERRLKARDDVSAEDVYDHKVVLWLILSLSHPPHIFIVSQYNVALGGKRRMDYISEEDTSVEERLDDEEWEFKCYCGVVSTTILPFSRRPLRGLSDKCCAASFSRYPFHPFRDAQVMIQ
jgi:hypothetical protein